MKKFLFTSGGLLIGALVALTLSIQATPTGRKVINLPNKPVQAPFSDAVLVGNTLYLAGRIGVDPETGYPPDDIEKEIRLLLDGFQSVLKGADMTMDDLVYVTVYCTDLKLYDTFNRIYRSYFKKDFPARAFVGTSALLRGGHFEMQGIAVKD